MIHWTAGKSKANYDPKSPQVGLYHAFEVDLDWRKTFTIEFSIIVHFRLGITEVYS